MWYLEAFGNDFSNGPDFPWNQLQAFIDSIFIIPLKEKLHSKAYPHNGLSLFHQGKNLVLQAASHQGLTGIPKGSDPGKNQTIRLLKYSFVISDHHFLPYGREGALE